MVKWPCIHPPAAGKAERDSGPAQEVWACKEGIKLLPASVIWLGLVVLFLVIEAVTVSLVSVWFGLGALAATLVSLAVDNVWVQIAVFLVVSAAAMAGLRPLSRRWLTGRKQPTNADRVIGATGLVQEAIDNLAGTGAVQVFGQVWTARSADGTDIPVGTQVTILRIEGVKLFVQRLEVPAQTGEKTEVSRRNLV